MSSMTSIRVAMSALALATIATAHDVQAQSGRDGNVSLSAELQAGATYDSNVSVDDLDANTGLGDWAAAIDASAEVKARLSSRTDASLTYDFSQTLHQDFTDFDLQSHMASASVSHDFGKLRPGAAYRLIHANLGGASFVTMHQVSPYASVRISKAVMLRAEYGFTDKNFTGRTDRDARTHAGAVDAYYFVNGPRTVLLAGYKYSHEDAASARYDYNGHSFKLRLTQKLPIGRKDTVLRLGWRHDRRDYTGITPSILMKRKDIRNRLQTDLELPISRRFFLIAEYEYANYNSNLPSADFRQSLFAIKLGSRF